MKPNPRDIDLVSFIPSRLFRKFEKQLDYYWTDNWEQEGIDAYLIEVFQEGQPAYNSSQSRTQEWHERYTKTKPVDLQPIRPKGYPTIIIE